MISRRGFLTWPLTLFGFGIKQKDEPVIVDGIRLAGGMYYIKAERDHTHTSGWRIWVESEPYLTIEELNSHLVESLIASGDLLVADDPGFIGFGRLHNCFIDEDIASRITRIVAHHK